MVTSGTTFWNTESGATLERGAPNIEGGNDYFYAFATHAEAVAFFERTEGAEEPLALIRQVEYIDEPKPGEYRHVKELRVAEWPVTFLQRPRRTPNPEHDSGWPPGMMAASAAAARMAGAGFRTMILAPPGVRPVTAERQRRGVSRGLALADRPDGAQGSAGTAPGRPSLPAAPLQPGPASPGRSLPWAREPTAAP